MTNFKNGTAFHLLMFLFLVPGGSIMLLMATLYTLFNIRVWARDRASYQAKISRVTWPFVVPLSVLFWLAVLFSYFINK